ncbi:ABC transporter substrate-binding protein [Paenibacillus oenotherae]|uniref:ABC transporter substrate-binding protein n=1 Tax=Paenibacillus oenotherae TaxID=1435645 RepID=A0ABS7DBG4_9BACL|nr:ABC transporter substrate-binding protein [Paenibacillus oenotherae]MBW7477277.1 ABC transporter substrate-binding protein [Paenibacillus oenotherae]
MRKSKSTLGLVLSLLMVTVLVLSACGNTENNKGNGTENGGAPSGAENTGSADKPKELTEVKQVLQWYAGPEFGGQYEADIKGYYEEAGLKVETQQGGASVSYIQLVASGKAEFGIAQGYEILQARENGIPLVGVAAIFQKSPQSLLFHSDMEFNDYSDLNGKTVIIQPGVAYWEYIKKKYNVQAKEVAYNGTLNAFLADKNAVQQGYATNEPFYAKKEGFDVSYKLNSDSGFNPYPDVIFTTEKYIKENPDIVKAFVQASIKGWESYNADPAAAHDRMKEENRDLDMDGAKYGWEIQTPLTTDGDAAKGGIGFMTEARWAELYDAMKFVDLLKKDQDVTQAFTTEFLPAQ